MNILQGAGAQVLEVSLGLSVVIAAMLVLRPLLGKRYRARMFYWVWLMVALRLAVPLNFSFFDAPVNIPVRYNAAIYSEAPAAGDGEALPPAGEIEPQDSAGSYLTLGQLGSLIRIAGAGAFLTGNLISYALFRRRVRRWSEPCTDGELTQLFRRLREEAGVSNAALAVCSAVSSPLVIGFFRPTLLLPREKHSAEQAEAVFRHELVHIGRRDLRYKLLLLIARSVHWFNPLVHLMARRAELDLEISCDEAVVEGKSAAFRTRYGHAVLAAAEDGLGLPISLTTHFKSGKSKMKERLAAVAGRGGAHGGAVMLCFLTLLIVFSASACSIGGRAAAEIADVLSGEGTFLYAEEGSTEPSSLSIGEVPALFDADDEYMEIQSCATVDLDGDGIEDAVLFVCGVSGDTGGYLVMHRSGDNVYGYRASYRGFETLKADGTFSYSDALGAREGVAAVSFGDNGLIFSDILSATGQAYVMDAFSLNGEAVTREEYEAARAAQALKDDAEWTEFSMP